MKPFPSLFKRLKRQTSNLEDPERRQSSPNRRHNDHQRIKSVSSSVSNDPKAHRAESTDINNLTHHLPHTLIISDLGTWSRTFRLQFSHFLPEDPSIAIFSESQPAPVPAAWHQKKSWRPWRSDLRCRWWKGRLQISRKCTVRVTVGSRWQYKISVKTTLYWSSEAGMLLVDSNAMYADYFEQVGKKKNKQRAHEIVRKFRKLEERTLVTETGATWTSYGDWDIHAPTTADVALACRYEGQGFENSLDPTKKRLAVRELGTRFVQLATYVKQSISKHIENRKWNAVE